MPKSAASRISARRPAPEAAAPRPEEFRGAKEPAGAPLNPAVNPLIGLMHGTLLALVRRDGRDLTARQLTAFLTIYTGEGTHTVSDLAELLHVSRPGVTRIVDRLAEFDLVSREHDPEDRRRVLIRRTPRGAFFFRELSSIIRSAARSALA